MDKLVFAVIMLFQVSNNNVFGTATGFFYEYQDQIFLITNRHVVDYSIKNLNSKLVIRLHTDQEDLQKFKTIEIPLRTKDKLEWYGYAEAEIDVAAIPISKELIKDCVISSFSSSDFPMQELFLEVGSELIVLGYPRGFTDNINLTPIAKTCIISTSLKIPFEGKPYFLMDGNLLPGMSGAPVIVKPSSSYGIKGGGITVSNEPRTFFLGIHSASISKKIGEENEPIYKLENGEIKIAGFKKISVNEKLGLQTCWYNGVIENLVKNIKQK